MIEELIEQLKEERPHITEVEVTKGGIRVTAKDPFDFNPVVRFLPGVDEHQLSNWLVKGHLIQNAFPLLNATDREFLMTGISDDDWDEMFEDSEEYYEDYDYSHVEDDEVAF